MMVEIFFAFLLIFCDFQASQANDLFTCYKSQYATVGKQFKVNCTSSSNHWLIVSYKDGSENEMIRCQKECNTPCSQKIGPRYEDGTQDIEEDGILLFTNVTEADMGNYTLEYTDCDGHPYSISFSLKEMVPVTTATGTLPPSTTHVVQVTTKSTEIVTTNEGTGASKTVNVTNKTTSPENSSPRSLGRIFAVVAVAVVLIFLLIIVAVFMCCKRSKHQSTETNQAPEQNPLTPLTSDGREVKGNIPYGPK